MVWVCRSLRAVLVLGSQRHDQGRSDRRRETQRGAAFREVDDWSVDRLESPPNTLSKAQKCDHTVALPGRRNRTSHRVIQVGRDVPMVVFGKSRHAAVNLWVIPAQIEQDVAGWRLFWQALASLDHHAVGIRTHCSVSESANEILELVTLSRLDVLYYQKFAWPVVAGSAI